MVLDGVCYSINAVLRIYETRQSLIRVLFTFTESFGMLLEMDWEKGWRSL